jgi:hypothetical protein
LRHPETLDAIADLCLSKARFVYLQDRDRICAVASIILNYADAGLRCPKDFETAVVLVFEVIYVVDLPEHSMVFEISQIIRLAERLILFPSFHRWNKHTAPPVRGCSVFVRDVSIRPINSGGRFG